jgi:hypothetical protein
VVDEDDHEDDDDDGEVVLTGASSVQVTGFIEQL